jgi:hypothetical protein
VLAQRISLSDGEMLEHGAALKHLAIGGDLSQWGMAAAVTRTAEDLHDYDRASTMESLGWDVINMPASAWREVAAAS